MKTISQDELSLIANKLESLKGFEVQGIYGSDDLFAIKLWNNKISWIYVSLKGASPFVFGPDELLKLNKRLTKPVFTFFTKHFKASTLKSVHIKKEYGRVLSLKFQSEESADLEVEIRLYRGGVNFGVFANSKSVFLNKPQELEPVESLDNLNREARSLDEIKSEILIFLDSKNKKTELGRKDTSFDKKNIAVKKISEAIKFHNSDPYLKLARKLERKEEVDKALKKLLLKNKSEQENIIYCFEQHKLRDQKIDRLKRRLVELESEVSVTKKDSSDSKKYKPEVVGIPRMSIAENITAFCGRKAKENLLLIRKAKAWYLWMHLKDYPSAHVVIEKNKNKELSENELKKAAQFLFFRGAPKKLANSPEVSFEVIFTEIRHVRPIKGDKLGRVIAQSTKSRLYLWKKEDRLKL